MTAAVTVTDFHNTRSGDIFHCIDPIPFGCDRGDFYASVLALRGADGTTVNCGPTVPILNTDFLVPPTPPWQCSTDALGLVAPITFIIRVYDFDGRSLNAIDGDDPVDIGDGYSSESLINVPLGTSTSTRTGDNGSITIASIAATVPLFLTTHSSTFDFDPNLGETARATFILGAADPSVSITAQVFDSTGNVIDMADVTQDDDTNYSVVWNGRNASNASFPTGSYRIQATATDGTMSATASSGFIKLVKRADALRLARLDVQRWWVTSGPLGARVFAALPTSAELALYQGHNCDGANKIGTLVNKTWALPQTEFSWNGVMPGDSTRAGQVVDNGSYAVGLHSISSTASYGCLPLDVVSAPTIRLYIESDPAVPLDGANSTIRVVALADDNSLRRTASIKVFLAAASELTAKTEPTTPPATVCQTVNTCTVSAPAASSPDITEAFGYRAVASDVSVGSVAAPSEADTGWHVSHRTTLATITSSAASRPNFAAGVAQQSFGTFSLAHAMDVGYRPGSGFDITTAAGWNDFMRAVRDVQRTLFGLLPNSLKWNSPLLPSALASNPQAYSQWIVPLPVSVRPLIFASSSADQLCATDSWNDGTFDAVGVLHSINCRDNSTSLESPAYFTAGGASVAWHELHHGLYGLGDEYDGRSTVPLSFDLPPPPRNVYDNPADCAADPLGTLNGACTEISATFAKMPFQPSGRFRVDPKTDNDVMENNGSLEQGADVRRVRQRTTLCRAGGC